MIELLHYTTPFRRLEFAKNKLVNVLNNSQDKIKHSNKNL